MEIKKSKTFLSSSLELYSLKNIFPHSYVVYIFFHRDDVPAEANQQFYFDAQKPSEEMTLFLKFHRMEK